MRDFLPIKESRVCYFVSLMCSLLPEDLHSELFSQFAVLRKNKCHAMCSNVSENNG